MAIFDADGRISKASIVDALERCEGNITHAASLLNTHRKTIYRRLLPHERIPGQRRKNLIQQAQKPKKSRQFQAQPPKNKTMNALAVFHFESQNVRLQDRSGSVWFVLADVCRVLEIANSRDAAARLDEDEKDDVGITDTMGREQRTTIINESGLYCLILTSRKEAARRFRKWVTAEVLPSIRKTGAYAAPEHQSPATLNLASAAMHTVQAMQALGLSHEAAVVRASQIVAQQIRADVLAMLNTTPVTTLARRA